MTGGCARRRSSRSTPAGRNDRDHSSAPGRGKCRDRQRPRKGAQMKFFGSKRASLTLVRAWCSPFGEDGPAGELLALVDAVLDVSQATPLDGSINHGHTQEMSSLRRALAKMRPVQLDTLLVHDEAGEVV